MKLRMNTSKARDAGILYVLVIELEDKELVKVGVTCRDKVEDRVAEILTKISGTKHLYRRR